ncbi:MAG TPA: outer membrane beta-barrel protein [Cyclobacteriaceae bacterium]|nr:outer membrane beta-barrel protein [Cyclobacteriaceae bacterium]HRJ80949.1 outer membrane beta-barrel protein [Cyclobacteriaceae bacterium]
MKTTIGIITLSLVTTLLSAQDNPPAKPRVGLYANGGTSSLVQGMGMNMNMYSSGYSGMNGNMTMYDYAGSWGGGVSLTLPLHQRWSLVGNAGYMNRGANYGDMYSSYDSRYRFSYIDVWALAQYNNIPKGQVKFTASAGLTESTLISARDETPMGNYGMMDNANRVDIGMVLGPGLEFDLKKGAIQTRLLYTYGFTNVFRGMYYDSGMHSNNAAFLLQVGYLFN